MCGMARPLAGRLPQGRYGHVFTAHYAENIPHADAALEVRLVRNCLAVNVEKEVAIV